MDKLLQLQHTEIAHVQLNTRKIHIRVVQYGKKRITTIEGLDDDLDLKRISRAMKKAFSCSVAVQTTDQDIELIQLQGDHREAVKTWLVANEVLTERESKDRVIIHGA